MSDINLYNVNRTEAGTLLNLSQTVALSTCFAIVMVCAIFGNLLVISVIARHKGMRTRTNMFLLNLAIADFLVGLTVVPFSLITLIYRRWIFGYRMCQINGFLNALLLMSSIHTLMYISIHKYLSILRPFNRFLTKRRILIMIAASWLYPFFLAVLTVEGLQTVVYKNGTAQCGPIYPHDVPTYAHHALTQITIIVIPLVILAYTYIRMYLEIKQHSSRLRKNSTLELDTIVTQQKKVTLTLFIVLACFMVCWMPYVLYSQYVAFARPQSRNPVLNIPAYFFGMLNSACNPVIYALRSQPFREGYLTILCRRKGTIMSDDTYIDDQSVTSKVNHLWSLVKSSVTSGSISKIDFDSQPRRKSSQPNVTANDSVTKISGSKSLTQLMKSIPHSRGNSVITKDGSTVVMKNGKIVCVRQVEPVRRWLDSSIAKIHERRMNATNHVNQTQSDYNIHYTLASNDSDKVAEGSDDENENSPNREFIDSVNNHYNLESLV